MGCEAQLAAQLYRYLFPFAWWQHRFGASLVNIHTDRHTAFDWLYY